MKNLLLVFVDEGNDNDPGIENQFDKVCDPLEAGIRTGIPDIEPKSKIKCLLIPRFR